MLYCKHFYYRIVTLTQTLVKMDPRQRGALQICLSDLSNDLNLQIQYFLRGKGIFTQNDLDLIKAEITQQAQRFKLLTILAIKGQLVEPFVRSAGTCATEIPCRQITERFGIPRKRCNTDP